MKSTPSYADYYPRTYIAPQLIGDSIITIDGNLSKPVWQQAPWSDLFDDIRGVDDAPASERPPSTCSTKFKMLWGDTHLYIGALLEADAQHPVVTTFKDRNDPIYQQDSDFEVFIDPYGTNHNYKEYEVNAWNTVWNLMLDKPYADGGVEHSGRIAKPGDPYYYEVQGQESATLLLEGNINAFSKTVWSVEIAMSYEDLLVKQQKSSSSSKPTIGQRWRMNFSRVERKGDINWTWQPQIEWNTQAKRYKGEVNMHMPNGWGYLIFGGPAKTIAATRLEEDPEWTIRMAAMNIYAAQQAYKDKHNKYTANVSELKPWLDSELMRKFPHIEVTVLTTNDFVATLRSKGYLAEIRQDRHLTVGKLENEK